MVFFAILLHGIVRTVLEESKVRLVEEMVSLRKSIAERMLNRSEDKMNEEVNLLKLDGSFRAAWNKWLETPQSHTKCSRVVCSNPKQMTNKTRPRDEETFLI